MKRYIFYILLLIPIVAWAVTKTINSSGSWDDPEIWVDNVVANDISDDVVIQNNTGEVTIPSPDNYSIGDLNMSNNFNILTIDTGATLNIGSNDEAHILYGNNKLTINANGTLEIWGDLVVVNDFILNVTGVLIVHGNLDFVGGAIIDIQGTVTVDKNLIGVSDNNINVDGTLNILGNVDMGSNSFLTGTGSVNLTGGCSGPASFCSAGPLDSIPPVISNCPNDIPVTLSGADCDEVVNWTEPIATDNTSVDSFTSTHNSGDTFPFGTTVVTYTATDPAGNVATCIFNVVVNETISPQFDFCPTSVGISVFDVANQSAVVTWQEPVASDNCGISSIISNFNSGDKFPAGLTRVIYTATDAAGNSVNCEFDVDVGGNKAPTGTPMVIDAFSGEPIEICLDVRDEDGDALELTDINSTVLNGVIERPSNASTLCFVYTSFEDFKGEERLVATVCDNGTPTACVKVEVRITVAYDLRLNVYKAFTPNNDNINDVWVIENIENYPDNQVMIYDRLGGLVYSAKVYDNVDVVWDGNSNQNGLDILASGTYFYKIDLGSEIPLQKGFIELIR